jgi:hypothetical protein
MDYTFEQYIDWVNQVVKELYILDTDIAIELVQHPKPDDENKTGCILNVTYSYPFTPANGEDRNRSMQWSVSRLIDISQYTGTVYAARRIYNFIERSRKHAAQDVLNIPLDSPLFEEAYNKLIAENSAQDGTGNRLSHEGS